MKKIILGICLLLFIGTSISSASGHFVYIIREDGVFSGIFQKWEKLEEADLATFELVGVHPSKYGSMHRFAKDKNHVYDYGKIVPDVSPEGFEVVETSWRYVKNKNHVYQTEGSGWLIVDQADPKTFHGTKDPKLFMDKNHVYYEYAANRDLYRIIGAEPEGFQIIDKKYAKDTKRVFYLLEEDWKERFVLLEGIDARDFPVSSSAEVKED